MARIINMALPIYSPDRRREVAQKLEIDEQYLYQVAKGLRVASPALARKWHEIDPDADLKELRPDDWNLIWPELIGTEGSPDLAHLAPASATAGQGV